MDITTNKSKKQYMFEEDQIDIGQSESQYKASLFGVLYVLLKDQGISIYTSCLLAVIQCIHLMFFAFHSLTSPMWSYTVVTDVLEDIFGYFNIVFYMKNASWNVFVALLYVFLGIIIFVLLDIAYVNFTFSRRKSSFSWSIWILKNLLLLFTTILFLPFSNYFVSILDCTKDYTGTYVHTYFSEVQCWTGEHIIHVCFAVISLILFSAVTLIASLTLFEYKNDQNNPSSKVSARPSFLLNLYQLLTIICLTFFSGIELEIIVLALIVGGSALLFTQFHFNCPFHDEILTKLWSILTALNLWTALMLVFARVLEGILFEGSVIAWIVGLPFITYIMYVRKDHRINLLLLNVNKFKSPIEIQNQARYVQKLIEWEQSDSNAGILLKGYLEIHKKSCNKEDCPLKQKTAKNARFAKSLMNKGGETVTEKYAMYIQLLYKTYADGVAKFPKSVALRISYAFFLLERMNSKQQALQELLQAEQNKPSLDEEFIIFRYKKIIEDEIAESQNENQGGMDVVTELTFQTHLRQIQANIEKATLLYMEFWAQLTEETPDLAKLNDIGSKINSSIQTVEDNWVKLIKVNPNNPVAMKLYGKFLLEIINDKEGGEDLIEKAMKLATAQANKKTANALEGTGDDDNHDVTPTIWMSGEHETLGQITGINLAAASLFGYNKLELMNKKVNVMMPELFSQHHDQFIEHYLNTGESTIIGKNKERLVFGKHKTEYVFPAYISLKSVQSIMQGIQFIATFRVEKNFKSTAYVITDSEGVIDSMTSSCINILRIDQRAVARKANIQDYVPGIIKNRSHLFPNVRSSGKSSVSIQYTYPKDVDYSYCEEGKNSVQLNCHLTDLAFSTSKNQVAGYQFRFDYVHERVVQPHEFNKNVKISNFQFRNDFEQPKASFVGEYVDHHKNSGFEGYNDDLLSDDVKSSDPDASFIRADSKQVSDIWKVKPPEKKEEEEENYEVKRTNYGVGIKTYKLYHGKQVDLDDSKSDSDEESSDDMKDQGSKNQSVKQMKKQEEYSVAKEEEAEADIGDLGNTFKSRKQLNMVVSDRTPPATVKNLKRLVNLLCLALGLVALLDYILANKEFDEIEKNIDYLEKANLNTAEFMNVLANTRDTYLYNIGVITSRTLTGIRNSMTTSLNAAKEYTQYLSSETSDLTGEHLSLMNGASITLTSQDGSSTQKSLIQASQEIISRGFALLAKTGVTNSDEDYYYITYNLLNDVYVGLRTSVILYGEKVNHKVNNDTGTFLILLIASILILTFALLILFGILYQINKSREEVLSLFLDIPEKTVKALFKKCETFITNLQIGDEEEVFSQVDDEDLDKTQADIKDSDSHEFIPRKKRKHFKNSGRSQKAFFAKFIILALIIEAFFIYNFVAVQQLLGDVSDQLVEFNATAQAEPFYAFGGNALKQLFIDKTFPVYNTDVYSVNTLANKMMYDLDAEILQLHAINRNLHTTSYSDTFNQIMMSNPCSYITSTSGKANCATFASQSVSQGISVASTKYFEDMRVLQRCWLKTAGNSACAIDLPTNLTISGYNSTQNLWFGLFITTEASEIDGMHRIYFKQTLRALVNAFQSSLSDELSNHLTIKLIIFIVFLVLIAFIYIILWLPLLRKINNDIWRTKSMLSMIPLGVISKIKSVRIYLKKFWSNQNFADL